MGTSNGATRWLPVVGYEGFYEVSDAGQVRSLDRVVIRRGAEMRLAGRLLRPTPIPSGHLLVGLNRNGRRTKRYVHQLVLEAFVGPCPPGMEACHSPDPTPSNNRLENLRWDTARENQLDRVRHGTHNQSQKERCPRGHLLVEPNLTRSGIKAGVRRCLSCARERSLAFKHNRPFSDAEADARYVQIMNRAEK